MADNHIEQKAGDNAIQIAYARDIFIHQIVNEKEPIFSGLKRFILALNLTVSIPISYFRGDPFPYARSWRLAVLCIKTNNKEVEAWFKEWFRELDELINNPKTASDLNKIASESGLVIELIKFSYAKNKRTTERLETLIADFQRIRSNAIEALSNYSQELARAHSNLVHLQSILHNSSPTIQEHLEIVADWIVLLVSYTNRHKNFTPINLVEKIDHYIRHNPDSVSPSILRVLSNVKYLLSWTIERTSKNSEAEIEGLLSSFPDLIPPTLPSGSFFSFEHKASKSSINQLAFVLQHARERFQEADSNQEKVKTLHQVLDKLTEDKSHLEVRLSDSNEQIDQKVKELAEKINEIKQLNLEYSNLESKQLEIERKLANITHDIRGLKTFLDETQNKASSVEIINQTLEMVTSLLNKSEAKNQQAVKTSSRLEEASPIERTKGEKAVTTSELVRWELLKSLWQESEKAKSDSSFQKYTKYSTGSIDLGQSYEDLYSQAKIDPQFRQQVLRRVDDLKIFRQSSTDAYLKGLKEIETRFRSLQP